MTHTHKHQMVFPIFAVCIFFMADWTWQWNITEKNVHVELWKPWKNDTSVKAWKTNEQTVNAYSEYLQYFMNENKQNLSMWFTRHGMGSGIRALRWLRLVCPSKTLIHTLKLGKQHRHRWVFVTKTMNKKKQQNLVVIKQSIQRARHTHTT